MEALKQWVMEINTVYFLAAYFGGCIGSKLANKNKEEKR